MQVTDVTVDIAPLLNLFMALVPFLLLCAAFLRLSVIPVSTRPTLVPSSDIDASAVVLSLSIEPTVFEIVATRNNEVVLETVVPRVLTDPEAVRRTYTQLAETAFRIKSQYRASDTVVMQPDDGIPYEEVVAAMDAMRDFVATQRGVRERVTLFPRVVLVPGET